MDIWTDIAGEEVVLKIREAGEGRYEVASGDRMIEVQVLRLREDVVQLFIGPRSFLAHVEPKEGGSQVSLRGHHYTVALGPGGKPPAQAPGTAAAGVGPQVVASAIPGKVVEVKVGVGQTVAVGDGLVVVEAMKMENELPAPKAGTIKEIYVKKGQAVEAGQRLVVIE